MLDPVEHVIRGSWSALAAYWLWNWLRVKPTGRREPLLRRFLAYHLPLLVAASMLLSGDIYGDSILADRIVPELALLEYAGAAMTVAGAALACWARWWLGRNWSLSVQVKRDHELIRSGPYTVVRHPIYSGLLLGFAGTCLAIGEWRAVLAIVVLAASFVYKLRVEERWMTARFGVAYQRYSSTTSALIPGIY